MNNHSKIFPAVCLKCGKPLVNIHTLGSGMIGIWCDSCLAGIPSMTIPAGETVEEALYNFELYEDSLKSGKDG